MRLLDQVAQARQPCDIVDARGVHRMPGVMDRAAAVAACPLRYVLEPRVAARCRSLLVSDRGMFDCRNDLLRAPAAALWLEWLEDGHGRVGLLLSGSETGRSGRIEVFWEQGDGEPILAQATLWFDFDGPVVPDGSDQLLIALHDHPLSGHLAFGVAPRWAAHFQAEGELAGRLAIRRVCAGILNDAEMLWAFSALLLHRPEIDVVESDIGKINRHRLRRRRAALLDHLEVTMRIDLAAAHGHGAGHLRRSSRLHLVRGHMVRRDDRIFWRRTHFRGDLSRPIGTRTVSVS